MGEQLRRLCRLWDRCLCTWFSPPHAASACSFCNYAASHARLYAPTTLLHHSSRKGASETAQHMAKEAAQRATGGRPSIYIRDAAHSQRLTQAGGAGGVGKAAAVMDRAMRCTGVLQDAKYTHGTVGALSPHLPLSLVCAAPSFTTSPFHSPPQASADLKNVQLRDCIRMGVGWHHAALEPAERSLVEQLFLSMDILVRRGDPGSVLHIVGAASSLGVWQA